MNPCPTCTSHRFCCLCWDVFSVLLFPHREAVKVNGQMDCHPSSHGGSLSPSRHTNVKKVTGVGGTTYEISVWAGTAAFYGIGQDAAERFASCCCLEYSRSEALPVLESEDASALMWVRLPVCIRSGSFDWYRDRLLCLRSVSSLTFCDGRANSVPTQCQPPSGPRRGSTSVLFRSAQQKLKVTAVRKHPQSSTFVSSPGYFRFWKAMADGSGKLAPDASARNS